jgi:parallel beta-helix repeat protein
LNNLSDNTVDLNNANGLASSSNKNNTLTDNNCSTSIPSGLCIS